MPYRLKKEYTQLRCPVFDCAQNEEFKCVADEEEDNLLFSWPTPCACYDPITGWNPDEHGDRLSTRLARTLSPEGLKYAFVHAIKTAPHEAKIGMGDQPADEVIAIKFKEGTLPNYKFYWDEGIRFDAVGQTYLDGIDHKETVLREPSV